MKMHAVILSPPDVTDGDGDQVAGNAGNVSYMNNQIMQLRKICNHPFLFRVVDEGFATYRGYRPGSLNADIWRSCGKVPCDCWCCGADCMPCSWCGVFIPS